ncbi:MAG: O-antigen ligase family protein [bacterium]|nr:O-antigen ligase family protein [bacterium]
MRISKWCLKIALFAPLIVAPLFVGETFSFPANSFFPFISLKAIYFRIVVEGSLFFFILHLIFSTTRRVQLAVVMQKLKKPISLAVIGFALVLLVTGLLGENPAQSFWSNFERGEGVFQIIHYCIFFLLVYILFWNKEEIYRLIKLNLIVGFLMSLYALTQLFEVQNLIHTIGGGGRISGTLGNPSYLAAYLLFNFALLTYLYLQSQSWKTRGWLIALAAFEFFVFINTGTRAAYLAFAFGMIIIYVINMVITKNPKTRSRLIIILAFLMALGVVSISAYRASPRLQNILIFNRLFDFTGAAEGFSPRIWTWGSALQGISERPILGWGIENFAYPFDRYYNPNHYGIESFFDRTHNVFLEYLIGGGIVLLLAYLAIWYFYYRALRGCAKNFQYSIFVTMPIVYFIQGFFLFDVLSIYLITFLFLALALNIQESPGNTELSEDGYEAGHTGLLTATGLLALFVYLIIATSVIPWKKNQLIVKAYGTPREQPIDAFNAFQNAILYPSPVGQEEAISGLTKSSIDFMDMAARQQTPVPAEIVRGVVDSNNSWFDTYKDTLPGLRDWYLNGGLNLRAGLSFDLPEYTARGKQIYADALAYAPKRIEFIQLLLEVARARGDKNEFLTLLARAKALRPDIAWENPTAN